MVLRLLTRLSGTGTGSPAAPPGRSAGWVAPSVGVAGRLVVEAAQAGLRTTAGVSAAAARTGRVARNAATPGTWRTGSRVHVPLRPAADGSAGGRTGLEAAARRVARTLRDNPEVVSAYWDGGLARLVLRVTEEAVTDEVTRRVTQLAARHGLERPDEQVLERAHPGGTGGVRAQALALACDAAGIATALTARTAGLRSSPRPVTAAVTLLREDSRIRAALRRRLGASGTEVLLAAANAAAHGFGQSPTALVLDAALRAGQLTEALARGAAFDAAHDRLCAPDRVSVSGERISRPGIARTAGQEYADQAVTGSAVGAAATLLFTRSTDEAAEAVLAGSPKAARYGPAAFTAALGTVLARHGVLVRDLERLRQLERVDALVLHADALRGSRRAVLEVHPNVPAWDHDRLWHAARAALRAPAAPAGPDVGRDSAPDPAAEPELRLRPVPDERGTGGRPGPVGLMIAAHRGEDVGTVLVGWEPDPLADALLDAARAAGLHVVLPDDPSLGDFTAVADEVVPADRALADVVRDLRGQGRVVLTVARVPVAEPPDRGLDEDGRALLAGLRAGDVALAVTDARSAVVWGADALVLDGLEGVWRLLTAVPVARDVGRQARTFAQAGTALGGLMVMTGSTRPRRGPFSFGPRLSPVNAAAAAALVSGWRAARRVAAAPAPTPRPRVSWHALRPGEARARLAGTARRDPGGWSAVRGTAHAWAGHLLRLPVLAPARLSGRLVSAVRAELDDPLTPLLAVGAAASAVLGAPVDALLVAGAMGVNAFVGGVQRLRAEHALTSLAAGQRRKARRVGEDGDGSPVTVEAARLAPGETIELRTGDVVPADARLTEVEGLEVDESALTGESLPVTKQTDATPRAAVAERLCMVFEGTTVVAGRARAVVVGTGEQTEAGRAAHLASHSRPAGGVQARLHELTRKVLPLTLTGGAAVTVLALLRGRPVREAVGGGVAVAVAAVPEGLPLVATVAQMAAARRLSRRGVLVRTPRALEALGRMDTICFDKTGTLTENRLHVSRTVTADGAAEPADTDGSRRLLRWAVLACPPPGDDTAPAHATDAAVLRAAPGEDPEWHRIDALPFEASRAYAGAVGRDADDTAWLVVKGAPEVVLPGCGKADDDSGEVPEEVRALADEGLRILAVARRRLAPDEAGDALEQPLRAMELLGFVALADTPRAGSAPLVADLLRAGVRPVMLTGDHPHTARAIAVTLGWPEDVTAVTGEELAALDRAGRARLLADCGVIARVAPEQKLQVVEALKEAGRVVAMVGDGANDAAAIRAADVGIGIAARGSAAARNAADLVLTDDELTPLVAAVEEGRALWRSVADAIGILIGGNAGEVGFTVLGTLLSGASPLSTRQMLLVNLLTDMFPAMAVAVTPQDDPEPGAPDRPAALRQGIDALGEPLTRKIRRRGVTTSLGAGTAWLFGTLTPGTRRRTSTMALCGLVGAQLVQTLAGRRRSPLVLTTAVGSAVALVALVQTPGVSHFFGCAPLGPVAWAGVTAAVAVAALGPAFTGPVERLLPRLGDTVPDPVRELWTRLAGLADDDR
ncbi:cation-translocating P-type ATPase [Streptomyces sp. NPDC018031]|uniref:cation-translocating P-type ATPase n=1 Tax=Streptomyces sp. NPDC018031 TaxID=3365033 RepID=UPI00379501A8